MKILFICTSNKDRSPALERYFRENYPRHEYRSAGVNRYFCGKHGTHYLTQTLLHWANFIVFAEREHKRIASRDFKMNILGSRTALVLGLGEYEKGAISNDYLVRAEERLKSHLK